tara:strand:+ start:1040 stop:1318 length:279 start_codon:yes stop_codon:yes gene_type:complete
MSLTSPGNSFATIASDGSSLYHLNGLGIGVSAPPVTTFERVDPGSQSTSVIPLTRKFATIDLNTGVATLVGDLNAGTGIFTSIAFHPADASC